MSRVSVSLEELVGLLNGALAKAGCGDCEVLRQNVVSLDNAAADGSNWSYTLDAGLPILRGHITAECEPALRRAVENLRESHSLLR